MIARSIARNTAPAPEEVARALTLGADEKVLLTLAAVGWLASRGRGQLLRRAANHALLVTVAASLLPHGLKRLFDQTRPDRRTVIGHVHGVPCSGKREDALPSGHALHMGALASASGALPTGPPLRPPHACDWPLADARGGPGALGERRRRRLRAGGNSRTCRPAVGWLSGRSVNGGRSCQSLKT